MTAHALIIGIGNPDCGDDAVGPLVVGRLAPRLPPDVVTRIRSGDSLALLDDWADSAAVILIDAAAPMSEPGRVHRIDPAIEPLPAAPLPASTHAFSVADAIALAGTLGRLPPSLVVYAVEGRCFDPGATMCAAVATAADEVVAHVLRELESIASDTSQRP